MSDFNHVDQHYGPLVEPTRHEADAHPGLRALLGDELDASAQLGFLIEFCALGVRMLRPVETSLRRGAVTYAEAGFDSLASDMTRLANDAASRRLRVIDDLVLLAALWTERGDGALDLGALVRRPPPSAALRHAALREQAANDPLSFAILGVELELAEFSSRHVYPLLRACERKLGATVLERTSYLQARCEHAGLRADDLLERLDDLLRAVPELAEPIAAAGIAAANAQLQVFAACVNRGQRLARTHMVELRPAC